jgi:hypothetical protein
MRIYRRCRAHSINLLALVCLFMLSNSVFAQAAPKQSDTKSSDIYMYRGAERAQRLIEGARKEATVAVYTSLNPEHSTPIVEAFEKEYAKYQIKLVMWRASGEKVVQRALTEAHAGHFTPDVFESESQELVKQRSRVPSSKAVDSPLNKFQYRMIDPAMVLDALAKWEKRWPELFLTGQPMAEKAG